MDTNATSLKHHHHDFVIERMSENDLIQVAKIERMSFPAPWSLSLFYSELYNPLARYYVARFDGKLIGYAGILVIQEDGQITTLAIHPDYRGRGFGGALLSHLLKQAVKWGLKTITLEVRESNLAAQRLYAGFGFEVVGKRPGYYAETGEDAVLMTVSDLGDPAFLARLGLDDDEGESPASGI